MAGRRIAVVAVIAGLVGAFVRSAGASTSSQNVSGEASGSYGLILLPNRHGDVGTYHSLSQLGNGTYDIRTTEATECIHGVASQSLTGSATLRRDDGAQLHGTVVGSQSCVDAADRSVPLTFTLTLTSGTRDLVGARVQFTGSLKNIVAIPDGDRGDETFTISGPLTTTTRIGWWTLGESGSVYAFGGAPYLGRAVVPPAAPAVGLAPLPGGSGYRIVNAFGQVYAFGAARWFGNVDRSSWPASERVVAVASTATGDGYWMVTGRGRVLPWGDAAVLGGVDRLALAAPIVAIVATPSGRGYYLVGADGGVFAFGDARFHGSTGALHLFRPIVGAAVSPDGAGYWLVAADGGVFAFDVPFRGSLGGRPIADPIVGASAYGNGYVLTSNNGDAFDFSASPFFGWAATNALTAPPIAGITALG